MVRILWYLGLVAVSLVSGHEYADDDDWYQAAIGKDVKDGDVSDGTDAISKFLGFKCPKGHRCLPVLECIPCDYGTYKSNEGSDLCKNCPSGCTTLRKGAASWKECVPKCPPGYEESECGKTCTKCRAGYYKSSWKNKLCNKCPMNSKWNRNMVGLKKKSQCYQSTIPECHSYTGDVIFALDASGSVNEDDFTRQLQAVNDFIEAFDVTENAEATRFVVFAFGGQVGEVIHFDDYSDKTELQNAISGLRWLGGVKNISLALDFIRNNLAYGAGNRQDIPDTAIVLVNGMSPASSWIFPSAESLNSVMSMVIAVGIGEVIPTEMSSIASNDDLIVRVANTEDLARQLPKLTKDACELFKTAPEDTVSESPMTSKSTTPGGDRCYQRYGACTVEEHDDVRLKKGLEGTNCQYFCQCAPASTAANGYVTYHWVEHMCGPGTLFDESLPGCNHDYNVDCTDTGPSTSPVTALTTTLEPTDSYGCTVGDMCTQHDYAVTRLKPLFGSGCKQFCQCAHDEGSAGTDVMYYWAEHDCPTGTLFDTSLQSPLCNHEDLVNCEDEPSPPYTTSQPNDATTTAEATPIPTPSGGDRCYQRYGTCTAAEHNDVRLKTGLEGTNCQYFCQCAPASTEASGYVTYYWVEHMCGPGTLFDESLPGCNHYYNVNCTDTGPSTTPVTVLTTTLEPTDSYGCTVGDMCTQHDYAVTRLKPLFGSGCKQFCQCAHDEGSAGTNVMYYWAEHTCPTGTLFDTSLQRPLCNHEDLVICEDEPNPPYTTTKQNDVTTTTEATPAPTPSDGDSCFVTYGYCSHGNNIPLALEGVDCLYYCQCVPESTQSDGTAIYYWQETMCPSGTIFVDSSCHHATLYTCPDESTPPSTASQPTDGTTTYNTTTPGPTASDVDLCFETYGSCNQNDYDSVRHEAVEGVDCLVYCHCAPASTQSNGTITYYWEEKPCATGTIFDNTLKVCVDATLNTCADGESQTTTTQTTTTQTTPTQTTPPAP